MMRKLNRQPRKTTLAAVALLGVTGLLAGCAADGGDNGGTATLTFLSWDSQDVMEPVIEAFEEAHPDIKVDASYAPPVAEYISTLQNRLLANNAPDVFVMGSENKYQLIEGGFVVDITDEPYMDVIAPLNKQIRGLDGRTYGLSVASWTSGIAYNEDLVAAAGWDEFPTDWDDFVQLLTDLKAEGAATPFIESWGALPASVTSSVGAAIAAGGPDDAAVFDGDATFEELWADSADLWAGLIDEGLIPREVVGITPEQSLEEFASGRAAMTTIGQWGVNQINDLNPDLNWAFAGIPQPDGTVWFQGNAAPGWSINSKAAEPEAAQAFLAFLASEEGVKIYQESTGSITTTSNFSPDLPEVLAPNLLAMQDGRVYLPQARWPRYADSLNLEAVAQLQLLAQGQVDGSGVGAALDAKFAELGG